MRVIKTSLSEMEKPRRRSIVAPLLLLVTAVLSCSAQTLTTVTGTMTDAFGNGVSAKLTATCSIRAGAVYTNGSYVVVGTSAGHAISVTNGVFSAALLPTDLVFPPTYHEMRCHVPMQTADGRNCEGNSSLVSQGLCIVGPGDLGPLYLSVPTSGSPVNLKDIFRPSKPSGASTWGLLLGAGVTWGNLLQGR